MSVLILMYHRARVGRFGNSPEMLDAHFAHVAKTYPTVLPGDAVSPGRLQVCLTFDDAYFDFRARVFPLLKRHGLRALLAVPTSFIREQVEVPEEKRLEVESEDAFRDPDSGGFCTAPELTEMATSGQVVLAAHGMTHVRLDDDDADLVREVESPQSFLRSRLRQRVDSFVFPYGRFSPLALAAARRHYRHVLRIGGAINRGWDQDVLYRVDADAMETPSSLFAPGRLLRYRVRLLWNRLRSR